MQLLLWRAIIFHLQTAENDAGNWYGLAFAASGWHHTGCRKEISRVFFRVYIGPIRRAPQMDCGTLTGQAVVPVQVRIFMVIIWLASSVILPATTKINCNELMVTFCRVIWCVKLCLTKRRSNNYSYKLICCNFSTPRSVDLSMFISIEYLTIVNCMVWFIESINGDAINYRNGTFRRSKCVIWTSNILKTNSEFFAI